MCLDEKEEVRDKITFVKDGKRWRAYFGDQKTSYVSGSNIVELLRAVMAIYEPFNAFNGEVDSSHDEI